MNLTDKEHDALTLRGDIKIIFKHAKSKTICRIMFNTAFIQNGNYIVAGKMDLSPEDIRKDKGKILPNDFKMYIIFSDFCSKCNPYTTEIVDLCEICKNELGPDII